MRHSLLAALLMLLLASPSFAADTPSPVGLTQIEFTDGDRHIALAMFYPAALADNRARAACPFLSIWTSTETPCWPKAAIPW